MKLHLVCGTNPLREVLSSVLVCRDVCVATDAHALAVYPTREIFDADFIAGIPDLGVLIHREDWPKITKARTAVYWKDGLFIAYIQSGKRAAFIEAEANEHPRPKDAPEGYAPKTKYPDWRHLVPTVSPDTVARNINVNAKILLNLQDALGLAAVSVNAPKSASGPMFVQSTSEQDEEHVGQYGIIMPIVSDR